MASDSPARPSARPDILGSILSNPTIMNTIVQGLMAGIMALIAKATAPKPSAPPVVVTTPRPAAVPQEPGFPDDTMPPPKTSRKVGRVRLKLARAQYSRERFPDQYTEDNPFGLYKADDLRAIQEGRSALNFGSKFWLDLTPYDDAGVEITRPEFLAAGLAYRTEHHVGDAFIVGAGALPSGEPADYKTEDTDQISNGITAWKSSLGCLHQMKAWGEGEFLVRCSIAGVEGDRFTLRVS